MSIHRVRVNWKRDTDDFNYDTYSRDHQWTFANGVQVTASAAPQFRGNEACVDPEESFVASLSSCHMLTFLAIAARKRWVVDRYVDDAEGLLEKNDDGKLAITQVTLRPVIEFSGERQPSAEDLERVHETSHHECFIANSVKTRITVEQGGGAS